MQYLIKAKNRVLALILLYCIVRTFVLGVFTIPVYAAGKKCACGVKGCKVCTDGCKGKNCAHISVRRRKKDGTDSTRHPYEKAVSCKKHPKLAQQGIVSMTYRYENGSWKHLGIALFADDSSISYNEDSKKYLAKNASNGTITVDDSTLAGKYAKKHKLDLYDMNERNKKLVAGKSGSDSSDSGSGEGGSVFGESGSDRRYNSKDLKYYDFKVDYNDSVADVGGYITAPAKDKNQPCAYWTDKRDDFNEAMTGGGYKKDGKTQTKKGGNNTTWLTQPYKNTEDIAKKLTPGAIHSEGLTSSENTNKYVFGSTQGAKTFKVDGVKASGVEVDGVQYLYCAIMQGIGANSSMKGWDGFGSIAGSTSNMPTFLIDVILQDGTQYHCITRTACGYAHSNSDNKAPNGKWAAFVEGKTTAVQDNISGIKAPIKMNDREFTFYGTPANKWGYSSINLFTSGTPKSLTKDNKVSVIRVWTTNVTKLDMSKLQVDSGSKDAMTKGTAPKNDGKGSGGTSAEANETDNSQATALPDGFYSEEALSSFTKLVEPELTDQVANSDKSALTQEETEGLSDWQMNVQRSREHKGIATWINYILTVIGVLLIIWGSIFYMAYWFDMINPFVDLDLVSRLSLGRFTASHELDGSCTWSLTKHTEGRGTRQQTINSKVALFISICAIAIGVLIISGGLYRIVRSIYYGGAVLFHQIFG